jgi:hypothetical protein
MKMQSAMLIVCDILNTILHGCLFEYYLIVKVVSVKVLIIAAVTTLALATLGDATQNR